MHFAVLKRGNPCHVIGEAYYVILSVLFTIPMQITEVYYQAYSLWERDSKLVQIQGLMMNSKSPRAHNISFDSKFEGLSNGHAYRKDG